MTAAPKSRAHLGELTVKLGAAACSLSAAHPVDWIAVKRWRDGHTVRMLSHDGLSQIIHPRMPEFEHADLTAKVRLGVVWERSSEGRPWGGPRYVAAIYDARTGRVLVAVTPEEAAR